MNPNGVLFFNPRGDRLYVPNKSADVFVLRASPRFECMATNTIGGEPMNASLAVSGGEIFIRTDKHLWCMGATTQGQGRSRLGVSAVLDEAKENVSHELPDD